MQKKLKKTNKSVGRVGAVNPLSPLALAMVDWVDSTATHGWTWLETGSTWEMVMCHSVGWIVGNDKESLTLAPHLSDPKSSTVQLQASGLMTIPKVAIKKIRKL